MEADGTRIQLNPGDIVMIPHGDKHIMENGPCAMTIDDSEQAAQCSCPWDCSCVGLVAAEKLLNWSAATWPVSRA